MSDQLALPVAPTTVVERKSREAAALRANLQRRKQQLRARDTAEPALEPAPDAAEPPRP